MIKKLLLICLFILSIVNIANADTVQIYFNYQTNSEVNSDNLNGNFNNLRNVMNGGIDNNNIDTTSGFRLYEVLGTLPAVGTQGRIVFYTVENSLNFDTGSVWVKAITVTAPAQGDIVYYNGTAWARLGAGTSGQILKTNGAGANPAWTTDFTGTFEGQEGTFYQDASNINAGTLSTAYGGTGVATSLSKTGSYTGNGGSQSIAHGLGATPDFIWMASLTSGATVPWFWVTGLGNHVSGAGTISGTDLTVDSTNFSFTSEADGNANNAAYRFFVARSN